MANGLLDMLGGALGTTPPSYMEGLLGAQATEDLRKRSIGSGLVNALVGYAAMPKNQNLGLGRILAGAAQAGIQGAQNVYTGATEDYMTQQKVADMKRKVDLQNKVEGMIANLSPEEQVYARLAPEQWVANKAKAVKQGGMLTPEQTDALRQMGYSIPTGALVQRDENGNFKIMEGTFQKDAAPSTLSKLTSELAQIQAANPNDPRIQSYKDAIKKESTFAPAASTTVNIADKTFDTEFAKGVGASVQDTFNKAAAAQGTLQKIQQLRPILKAGVYSGPLSGAQTTIAQIADKLGTAGKDTTDTLNRTAEAMQGLASFELDAAAAMRGQGAITENERMLIQRAAAGRLDQFTSPQIQTLLNALEKTGNFRIQAHTKNLERLKRMPNVSQYADFYSLPAMPKEVNY